MAPESFFCLLFIAVVSKHALRLGSPKNIKIYQAHFVELGFGLNYFSLSKHQSLIYFTLKLGKKGKLQVEKKCYEALRRV